MIKIMFSTKLVFLLSDNILLNNGNLLLNLRIVKKQNQKIEHRNNINYIIINLDVLKKGINVISNIFHVHDKKVYMEKGYIS